MPALTWGSARVAAVALCALLATGCTLYRIDIQQGNVVTPEMVARLKPDMTRQQVRFILGTPLVADPFHPERWDYFYRLDKGGSERARRRLTLGFEADRLVSILDDGPGTPVPASAPATPAARSQDKP